MAQLAIYLDDKTARRLARAARRDGLSRSAWVRMVLNAQLDARFPESFYDVLGKWEDDRDPDEILRDIRAHGRSEKRPKLG